MSKPVFVYVEIEGESLLVGRMYSHQGRGAESASFIYDETYLSSPNSYALDPTLPLNHGTLQTPINKKIFASFADSSPDRWGRNLIERKENIRARNSGTTPHSMSELEILLGVRDDLRQGALRFRREEGPFLAEESAGIPTLIDLPKLLDFAQRVDTDTAGIDEIRELIQVGSSLGGARPKAHVLGENGQIAIAKFPSKKFDRWNVIAWEKTMLDLAKAAGITVPNSQLVNIGTNNVLIIDRFDRNQNQRVGYISTMTMLEASDGDMSSYLNIASVLEEVSPSATKDLAQLWRRIAFNILASNTDDHLRNHGFLHVQNDSWTLAPAFDLNPDPTGRRHLSTAINEKDPSAKVDLLLSVAQNFRLGMAQALHTLSEVHTAIQTWRSVASAQNLKRKEVEQMAPAFIHSESIRTFDLINSLS